MNKKLLVGSLAVVGGLALVAYLLKSKSPRRNSEGFFNASGGKCLQCKRPNGSYYIPQRYDDAGSGECINGAKCVSRASIQG
jgi:hypothetical protein